MNAINKNLVIHFVFVFQPILVVKQCTDRLEQPLARQGAPKVIPEEALNYRVMLSLYKQILWARFWVKRLITSTTTLCRSEHRRVKGRSRDPVDLDITLHQYSRKDLISLTKHSVIVPLALVSPPEDLTSSINKRHHPGETNHECACPMSSESISNGTGSHSPPACCCFPPLGVGQLLTWWGTQRPWEVTEHSNGPPCSFQITTFGCLVCYSWPMMWIGSCEKLLLKLVFY